MYPYRNIFKLCVSSLTWHPLSRHQLWLFSAEWQSASPLSLPLCRLLHRHPLSLSAATEADRATKILSVRRLRARGCATQEWHREGEIGRKGPERQEEVGVGGNLTKPQKLQQFSKSECWIIRWMWKQNAKKGWKSQGSKHSLKQNHSPNQCAIKNVHPAHCPSTGWIRWVATSACMSLVYRHMTQT